MLSVFHTTLLLTLPLSLTTSSYHAHFMQGMHRAYRAEKMKDSGSLLPNPTACPPSETAVGLNRGPWKKQFRNVLNVPSEIHLPNAFHFTRQADLFPPGCHSKFLQLKNHLEHVWSQTHPDLAPVRAPNA